MKNYVSYEKEYRGVTEFTISVNQDQVSSFLNSVKNNSSNYDVEKNSCVTNSLQAIKQGGVKVGNPNGLITVEQIYKELNNSSIVTNKQEHSMYTWSSFTGRLLYDIFKTFNYNPTGKTLNTNQIIPIK